MVGIASVLTLDFSVPAFRHSGLGDSWWQNDVRMTLLNLLPSLPLPRTAVNFLFCLAALGSVKVPKTKTSAPAKRGWKMIGSTYNGSFHFLWLLKLVWNAFDRL